MRISWDYCINAMILEMNEVQCIRYCNCSIILNCYCYFLYGYIVKVPDFKVNLVSKYGLLVQYSLANIEYNVETHNIILCGRTILML